MLTGQGYFLNSYTLFFRIFRTGVVVCVRGSDGVLRGGGQVCEGGM